MKKTYLDTDKMYYGFPVFLLGYKDEAYGYNFTTVSSSYSLGDMMVVGIYKFGNALKQIKKFGCFTINLPDRSLMREIEIGGFCSGEDKFGLASNLNYFVSSQVDAPI
ncbi:MAG: flavin reductase family protein, partial [Defluviitaleaceae bacterium]|nr:flavin reductase family protein [Defluviitaleaceae bacterium]